MRSPTSVTARGASDQSQRRGEETRREERRCKGELDIKIGRFERKWEIFTHITQAQRGFYTNTLPPNWFLLKSANSLHNHGQKLQCKFHYGIVSFEGGGAIPFFMLRMILALSLAPKSCVLQNKYPSPQTTHAEDSQGLLRSCERITIKQRVFLKSANKILNGACSLTSSNQSVSEI